jgi:hypothetical protein
MSKRTIQLRDLALRVMKTLGDWEDLDGLRVVTFNDVPTGLSVIYTTPFQKLPGRGPAPEFAKYLAAQARQQPPGNLPYGLDIWAAGKKVLNIEWSSDGRVDVIRYKPGDWEQRLLKLADE